jgi:phosphatidylserine decarboxylase
VAALQNLLDTNPCVRMLFNEMLSEVPIGDPRYRKDPSGGWEITEVDTLIQTINQQVQEPIGYNDSPQIGTPINAILDWPMGTKSGFAVFLRDDVDQIFRDILNYWGRFLQSPKSASTVTTADTGAGSRQQPSRRNPA